MPIKLTQEETEERVLKKCKEKDYQLIDIFVYKNAYTKIHLKCNKDDYEWYSVYNNFINGNNGCSKCVGNLRLNQDEVEERILQKCKKKNYELIDKFIYNNIYTKIHLKCNIDNYEWYPTYNDFINGNYGCRKCSGNLVHSQCEAEEKVLKKCKEKNYELIENFVYKNNSTKLHLKCNIDNYEWVVTFHNYIDGNFGCPKCGGGLKLSQQEAEKMILKKCKEKNYELIEKFIYRNAFTQIHLRCKKDNHEWKPKYTDFINGNYGCFKCNESHSENKISEILKNNNIKFIQQKKFKDCKNKRLLPFDFYLPKMNILIEYDGKQHFKSIKYFGGEEGLKKRQINDQIKDNFAKENNIKLIRISYKENIEDKLRENNIII
jgi:hypothetical protein